MEGKTAWIADKARPINVEREMDVIYAEINGLMTPAEINQSIRAFKNQGGTQMTEIDPSFTYLDPQQGPTMARIDLIEITREMAPSLPPSFDLLRQMLDLCFAKRESVLLPRQFLVDIGALVDYPVITYERIILG